MLRNADSDTDHPNSPPLPVTVRSNGADLSDDSGKESSSYQAASSSRYVVTLSQTCKPSSS